MKKFAILVILLITQLSCTNSRLKPPSQPALYKPENENIRYTGRIDFQNPEKPRLSGAGSYFRVKFSGSTCDILLEDQNLYNNHSYISTEIDGKYQGRIKVTKDKTQYEIARDLEDTEHTLVVCKVTEAQNGYIGFLGLMCPELLPLEKNRERKIEFIGDSITCGMGLDASEIPCDSAQWYDQHNAYLAYGPLVARKLNADWLLSSVSGIGIIRNWNSPGPTMPDVYNNTYLNMNSTSKWDARNFVPDLVSICLGTNDFSDGDGSYERVELDSAEFIAEYIRFVKRIRSRYPNAQICCLSSPMLSGQKSAQLQKNLSHVIQHMQDVENDNKVHMFVFSQVSASGCSGHPNEQEHREIAKKLLRFFEKVMDWQ
jgi:lysophospholipase L1-like esterase